jgi:hypothetical protein
LALQEKITLLGDTYFLLRPIEYGESHNDLSHNVGRPCERCVMTSLGVDLIGQYELQGGAGAMSKGLGVFGVEEGT